VTVRQVEEVRHIVEQTVGPTVLGMYLHGSATDGGLKPASDLDLLVVSDRSLHDAERRALVDELVVISGRPADQRRSVELTVVVRSEVRPWRYPPRADFLYGDWLRADIEANGPPQPSSMPNLAIEIPQLLARGTVVMGPDAHVLLDPVPVTDTQHGSLDAIPSLLNDLHDDTRNVVLTLARIWATIVTGRIMGKEAAATWALERLSPAHRPVLQHARGLYLTSTYAEEAPWDEDLLQQVQPHVDAVVEEIARAVAHNHRLAPWSRPAGPRS